MSETKGKHRSKSSGREYRYVFSVRPGGKEMWSAHVFRDNLRVSVLARGLVESELNALDVTQHVRSLVLA